MNFRISDTFTDSLARLSAQEQKAVKTTAFDLQLNPASPGLKRHRIERSKDANFWSVRVNADIRVVTHQTASSVLLCFVGHHDDAYRWAERRRIETHPATGAAQIVELRATVEEIKVFKTVTDQQPAGPEPALFADVPDDDLLAHGVPRDWLGDVKAADEDMLFRLAPHLPREAVEALLEIATGGTPSPPVAAAPSDDPFAHPDAQRRFRGLANVAELEQALDFPWERWTVFLHPVQRRYASQDYTGPARVSGSAGTGKSVVALHRAAYLARKDATAAVLVTTFSPTLARALRVKLGRLLGQDPATAARIHVGTIGEIGGRIFTNWLEGPRATPSHPRTLATRGDIRAALVAAARTAIAPAGDPAINPAGDPAINPAIAPAIDEKFLMAEWDQVIDAWQVDSWERYREIPRLGRKTRIGGKRRAVLWAIFAAAREQLHNRGLITEAGLYQAVIPHINASGSPYDHVIVDEAQDVSVPELRLLAALASNRPDGLFFTGDLGQRIFQLPFSWKALGVDIRGRSYRLRINYRTSHQIRGRADRLLPASVSDVDGIEDSRRGTQSVFNGPPPEIAALDSEDEEIDHVRAWLEQRDRDGILPGEIGVFVRTRDQIARARKAVAAAGQTPVALMDSMDVDIEEVAVGTMHLAKGLEFKAVVVMACDDEVIPLQSRIEGVSDMADLDDVYATERHLLYVACTRARDHLLVTGVDPASEFLDDFA